MFIVDYTSVKCANSGYGRDLSQFSGIDYRVKALKICNLISFKP